MEGIKCKRCGGTKSAEAYSLDRGRVRQPCKECRAEAERLRRAANAQREVVDVPEFKWCAGCERVHPSDAFARDSNSSDGLQSACRVCQRKRTRKRTTALKRVRHHIIQIVVVNQQNWECPGCGRSPALNRERYGRTRIEWDSNWRVFDSFYASLVVGWIHKDDWTKEPGLHAHQIAGVVQPTLTASSLAEEFFSYADRSVANAEIKERCKELVGICLGCHGKFLRDAGVLQAKQRNNPKRY
jgi:hypothetical protein